jgi:hypothetical protein
MATTLLQPGAAPANAPTCITAAEQFIEIGGRLLINRAASSNIAWISIS